MIQDIAEQDTAPLDSQTLSPHRGAHRKVVTDDATNASRPHDPGLRRARDRAARTRRSPVATADVAALTLTVIVPAHNEEAGLPETLSALLKQTMPPDRIIVVDDGSNDGTAELEI